ncbi:energy-coupling factor transporter transmembrane component T [Fructilactobacillus vespulae]|uniref:energy-coupling factor transporter transmembrane component T family protein n=1 Tax=Fructilactobacillus vespulae TaxID=1249630 RepID=UPI0039B3E673
MNQIVFGNYLPGNSWIHRLNPVLKIIASLLLISWTLIANNLFNYGFLIVFIGIEVFFTGINLKIILKAIKPFIWLIGFTVIMQILFANQGPILFSWGIFKITQTGINLAILIFFRFLLIIIQATVLTLTTSPNSIAFGVEKMISPLKKLGIPVETVGIMISIALRFVPTLIEELYTIMEAQKSRGVIFGSGSLIKRCKSISALIIPILVSSFRHADNLADSLEASGYDSTKPRSSFRKNEWRISDTIALALSVLVGVVVFVLRSF